MRKLIDASAHIVFSDAWCKMNKGYMVISKGFRFEPLYKLEACTVECNNTFVKSKSVDTLSKNLRVSLSTNGHGFWVPNGAVSFEAKLLVEKTILWH